jgi:hypothetical protein
LRELAHECFPNNELAAEIIMREAFDAEETVEYTADLDGQVEELHDELREEGPDTDEDNYVHLDDNDLDANVLANLPDDAEAEEAATE